MSDLSMKSKILLLFRDHPELWEQDAVDIVMKEEGTSSDYWKNLLRYYLLEMSSNGMLEAVDYDMDDGSHFSANHSLTKYKITAFGMDKIRTMLE